MGRSTLSQLLSRAKTLNDYNNNAVESDGIWIDHFNSALQDLVEDIGLKGLTTISYVNGTTTYDLPSDFFEVVQVVDSGQYPIWKREYEIEPFPIWNSFYIKDIGSGYQMVFDDRNANETLTVSYIRYPALLSIAALTQRPEVPTIGEDALINFAIARALRNNNQLGQAMTVLQEYERDRKKIRDAKYRAMAGW